VTPLATLLAHIGWTTGELARRLGVTDGTVRNWVTGRRSPSPSVLLWLADIADAMDRAQPLPDGWDGGHVGRPRVSG
jgi:transcriptional regulator with XRE-family HTH domain